MRGFRDNQVAIVDAVKGTVIGKRSITADMRLVGIGEGLFALTTADERSRQGEGLELAIVNADLVSIGPTLRTKDRLVLGFSKGYIGRISTNDPSGLIMFRGTAELQAQVAAVTNFQQKLKSGDDSHCGLVIERKGVIALVETPIGQKWLKVSQLYVPGGRNCRFLNGVIQE